MDDTNNTPDVNDRNIMIGAIFLQPTKTAEFIQFDFNILPTGASFNAYLKKEILIISKGE